MAPGTRRHDPLESGTPPLNGSSAAAEPVTNGTTSHIAHDSQSLKGAALSKPVDSTKNGLSNEHENMTSREDPADDEGQSSQDEWLEEDGLEDEEQSSEQDSSPHGKKRKISDADTNSHKIARHSSPPTEHTQPSNDPPSPLSSTDRLKLLNFLLSPASLTFARPKDEEENLKTRPNGGAKTRTYATGPFTPFEELLNAVILARPIGHTLGVRTIRTLLNPPFNLMSPKLIQDSGVEKVYHALEQARTQHRQKTAEEIVLLADAVSNSLGEDHFDGSAKTGLDIFARRIQGSWGEWYPFADQKTLEALEKLGLPGETQQLKALLDDDWKHLRTDDVIGDGEESKRRVFVRVLERAIGAHLEGRIDEMKAKALE